jgi:hypothetical protein
MGTPTLPHVAAYHHRKSHLKLTKQIADREIESVQQIAKYIPTIKTRTDDLGLTVIDLLRQLPGVAVVGVAAKEPTSRIIHLRDWHHVPEELYALDMKAAHGKELTADEIDQLRPENWKPTGRGSPFCGQWTWSKFPSPKATRRSPQASGGGAWRAESKGPGHRNGAFGNA